MKYKSGQGFSYLIVVAGIAFGWKLIHEISNKPIEGAPINRSMPHFDHLTEPQYWDQEEALEQQVAHLPAQQEAHQAAKMAWLAREGWRLGYLAGVSAGVKEREEARHDSNSN